MNKKLLYYTVAGIIFTAITGSLCHFAYEFSRHNPLVGLFVPVTESVWEHMKMIFFPSFIYSMLGWPFFYRSTPMFFGSFLTGVIIGTLSIVVIYYTYTGILGFHSLYLDILTFLVGVLITFCLSYQLIVQKSRILPVPFLVFLIVLLIICFVIFTNLPPNVALFNTFPQTIY